MNPKIFLAVLMVAALPTAALSQEPPQSVSPARHGNLAAAQALSREAYDRLTAAQQANEFDMGGHAAQAKALLMQANQEIALAAQTANRR